MELSVSSHSSSNGYESWYYLQPGQRSQWNCAHWEVVSFRQPGVNSTRAGVHVLNGDTIAFHNFSNIQTTFTPPVNKFISTYFNAVDSSSIMIENSSLKPINAFIAQWAKGSGNRQSLTLQPGSSQLWHGVLSDVVVFENPNDGNQNTGVYVSGGTRVVFNGFDGTPRLATPTISAIRSPSVIPSPKKVYSYSKET